MTATALTMAMTALADPRNAAKEVAHRLGITTTTCALSDILATSPYNLANSRIMMAIE
jgi:hypothetical protein